MSATEELPSSDLRAEYARLGAPAEGGEFWRLDTSSNRGFKLCPTYPDHFAVPVAAPPGLEPLLSSPLLALYTPFSILLVYEVYQLIQAIPQSFSAAMNVLSTSAHPQPRSPAASQGRSPRAALGASPGHSWPSSRRGVGPAAS